MKTLILALALIAGQSYATAATVEEVEYGLRNWRNNTHHNLVNCSMFYKLSAKYFYKDPKMAKDLNVLAERAMDYAFELGLPQAVTIARIEMFVNTAKRTYVVEGGFSIMMAEYQYACPDLMNNVGKEAEAWIDKAKAAK